ncbi:MAG: hypothetical protein JSS76_02090 [Bacteroidetes bacterium]|nr:hypothetical protein [Bacteroidota bacterium]
MSEPITIKRAIERRTYLKGKLKGKYWAYIDHARSDQKWENHYSIEIYEANVIVNQIDLKRWDTENEFIPLESPQDFLLSIPNPLNCSVIYPDGSIKYFGLELLNPQIFNPQLYNQLYEGDRMFGTIECEISGYIRHFDYEEIEVDSTEILKEKNISEDHIVISDSYDFGGFAAYGTVQTVNGYTRRVISNLKSGSLEWSKWTPVKGSAQLEKGNFSNWYDGIFSAIGYVYFFFVFLIVFFLAWKVLIPIAIVWLIFILISLLPSIFTNFFRWGLSLFSIAFVLYLGLGFINLLQKPLPVVKRSQLLQDDSQEKIRTKNEVGYSDSLISHMRIWKDYRDTLYQASIDILKSDLLASQRDRTTLPFTLNSTSDYNLIVDSLSRFDNKGLKRVYFMFDSLRTKYKLSETQFAEVIVSCIQDIPYVLVLDKDCSATSYNDGFIKKYLQTEGNCEGNVKYGLFSPVEFAANIKGDCDTRALLLYTVLAHFNYDVVMLGSITYQHSLIGVNLPYSGTFKMIQGKRYVLWETTSQGIRPGEIPLEISNTNFWQVNLLSKPITVI